MHVGGLGESPRLNLGYTELSRRTTRVLGNSMLTQPYILSRKAMFTDTGVDGIWSLV